ncbi:hypothetical protein FNH05_24865 [Amycolatopsis rhizosphaerae]|uniref:Ig-like domain repeat protein n=1 Tax=Amycolatopsis rhizosphaerae TaxID=2053003 RepID=A0A558BLZ5_9PSEU|nr:hypothetical protein [Amycolatopsis rhizosphaerae]TVT37539.1 hypothetical protein FNH05_24865 [Amycolatopsis rhizosphaerae]
MKGSPKRKVRRILVMLLATFGALLAFGSQAVAAEGRLVQHRSGINLNYFPRDVHRGQFVRFDARVHCDRADFRGTVTFYDLRDHRLLGRDHVDRHRHATIGTRIYSPGRHMVRATFDSDRGFCHRASDTVTFFVR